jgi:adenylate cyclase
MMSRQRRTGWPLVRTITCINIVFLAILSFIVAALVYDRIKAELTARAFELSWEAASNTAARLEKALGSARADALALLELNGGRPRGGETIQGRQRENDNFFALHPEFAALISSSGARLDNQAFFVEHNQDRTSPDRYLDAEHEFMERAAALEAPDGMLLGNASPYFDAPVIALFFRDRYDSVFAAFLSADAFMPLLEGGPEKVFVVNHNDGVILHTDLDALASGENYWQDPFVRLMRNSAVTSMDNIVLNTDDGEAYLGAFQKLRTAGAEAAVLCETARSRVLGSLRQAIRASLALCGAAGGLVIIFSLALSFSMKRYVYKTFVEQEKEIVENRRLKSIFCALPDGRKSDIAALEKTPLNGENRDVTVVFAGLHGRAAIKDLSPRRTLKMLNDALALARDSFAKTGGAADKVSGDSLTGVWGVPFSDGSPEMDALNAVRGALILRAALVKRGLEYQSGAAGPGRRITVSCGINSGTMLAGRIGAEEDSVYTVTGGAAKRARLMELLSRRFGADILISENTMVLAGKYFITEEMPPVNVSSHKKPLRVFAVINVKVTKKGVEQPKPTNMAELRQLLEAAQA